MDKSVQLSRRKMFVLTTTSLITSSLMGFADTGQLDIYVVKNAQCGCCDAWVKILSERGFNVTTENQSRDRLMEYKAESGITEAMRSCHTARINSYFIEGHVPASDIKRLLTERPDVLGLAVPGMPYGSPGMGSEENREAYDVFIIRRNGTFDVFQHYPKAGVLV